MASDAVVNKNTKALSDLARAVQGYTRELARANQIEIEKAQNEKSLQLENERKTRVFTGPAD